MSPKIINIVVVSTVIVLSLAILGNSMTKPIGRDEQMYCTGGVLLSRGYMIYRDFSYAAQMPLHALLYAAVFRITGTSHYLLAGRMVSVLCDVGVLLCIVGIYRRIFKSYRRAGALLGVAAAVLYAFNPVVEYANGYAWNHDVVIFCVMLSVWLFISGDGRGRCDYLGTAGMGVLLTLATCMRITTALVEALFFVMLAARPAGSLKARVKSALPFVIGAGVVLIWPVLVIASAWPAFVLNLFQIPALYGRWLHEIGMTLNKLDLVCASLARPGYLALLAIAVYLCLMLVLLRRRLRVTDGANLLLCALLPLVFFVIALIPPTMWLQYMAVPVPFLVIGFAYPLLYLWRLPGVKGRLNRHVRAAAALVAVCVVVAVGGNPAVPGRTLFALVPESWTPVELHRISVDIASKAKEPKLALTLGPLFALEGGCEIYPELSAGAIIYRIADRLSPEQRAITHTVGPKTLGEMTAKSPSLLVIVRVEQMEALEAPLYEAAVGDDWQRENYENGPIVYWKR